LHADGMLSDVLWPSATETVTIKARHWLAATTFQFCSQNIRGHR
jgi:hypothetical protein